MNYYIEVLKKYAVFSGRARRKEYWMFVLFNLIISIAINLITASIGALSFLSPLYGLAVLTPGIAVGVRRLHDTNRSGWWWLLLFIPVVGAIVLIIFFAQDSQPGENQYGPNPKEAGVA
jgi:uncharacterized membrane protein YhaH (DUF805 family)